MSEKLLCSGTDCPLRGECAKWDGNNDCYPGDCEGLSYFVKPPWKQDADGGFCDEYRQYRREKGGGRA